jgi:hypothetical protein
MIRGLCGWHAPCWDFCTAPGAVVSGKERARMTTAFDKLAGGSGDMQPQDVIKALMSAIMAIGASYLQSKMK